jgi:UDP-N-acetylglucosamine acyltransferase
MEVHSPSSPFLLLNGAVMPKPPSVRVHSTAIVSAEAVLADDVEVGAYALVEGPVRIGPGCIIRPRALLCGPLTLGANNIVYSGAVIGERPQHLRYQNEPTGVEIGNGNVFREGVSIHRGTTQAWTTRIGDDNYFMVNSHVAHDCRIGNRCIVANGALVGGHCVLEDNVYLSGNCAIHQFVRVGRLALLSGCSATTKDIPPFVIQQAIDSVAAVNVVGMRRAGISNEQITAVRKAFRILFQQGLVLPAALAKVENELGSVETVREMLSFIRQSSRGINSMRSRRHAA